jgi:hypothetical protein
MLGCPILNMNRIMALERNLVTPGHIGYLPPGHNEWIIGNEPRVAIDFAGI